VRKKDNYLIISDLQMPFHLMGNTQKDDALKFCSHLKAHYNIPDNNVYNVGDEVDQYWGSQYAKDPNALHTPASELQETIDMLKHWYSEFPQMKLCTSNHGIRWMKKASEAGIPSELVRDYKDILEAPKGWRWKDEWIVKASKHRFRVIHGHGYSGVHGAKNAAVDSGISTAIGHIHSHAATGYVCSRGRDEQIWYMNTACLIDNDAYAFAYNKIQRNMPVIGVGVVVDGGRIPIFHPMELK